MHSPYIPIRIVVRFIQVFYDLMREIKRRKGGPMGTTTAGLDPSQSGGKKKSGIKKLCSIL